MKRAAAACLLALALLGRELEAGDAASAPLREIDAQRARQVVADVLSASEFRDKPDSVSFWSRVRAWLADAVGAIGRWFGTMPGWLVWLIVLWLVLALIAILIHLLYTLIAQFGLGSTSRGHAGGAGNDRGVLLGINDLDFDRVYQQARLLAEGGDWGHAARYLYVAAILWLDRSGLIAFQPHKTNRDLARELATRGPIESAFIRLTNEFESTAYGGVPASETSCRTMQGCFDAIQRKNATTQV